MKLEGSLRSSQGPATDTYPEPDEGNTKYEACGRAIAQAVSRWLPTAAARV
jgi:hypothetical protein